MPYELYVILREILFKRLYNFEIILDALENILGSLEVLDGHVETLLAPTLVLTVFWVARSFPKEPCRGQVGAIVWLSWSIHVNFCGLEEAHESNVLHIDLFVIFEPV